MINDVKENTLYVSIKDTPRHRKNGDIIQPLYISEPHQHSGIEVGYIYMKEGKKQFAMTNLSVLCKQIRLLKEKEMKLFSVQKVFNVNELKFEEDK